jgi:flagella basal body P-ring formation protein FlgA
MRKILGILALVSCLSTFSADEQRYELKPQASANSQGIFLSDLVGTRADQPLPRLLLAAAPQIGRPVVLTRAQVNALITQKAPELVCTNWVGADRVKITRATRILTQAGLSDLLTAALQNESVKDQGELELRFTRPWNSTLLPDEPLSVKILEMPTSGVSPNFICRFELFAGGESVGVFQQSLSAKVWKEVYVAHSNLLRGQLLRDADIALDKRDILTNREFLNSLPLEDPFIEFRESIQAGNLITSRSLRLRAVLKRGRQVEAMFQDAALTISVRAEALEDGVPGQIVRLRNAQTHREFKGKVQDEQTVLVLF